MSELKRSAKMKPRIHVSLLLVSFCCIVWTELPDAAAPLILAIPFFGLTALARDGVHAVDFAALLGFIAIVLAIAALIKKEERVLILATKVGLGLSAVLFIGSSRPITQTALTAVPFAFLLVWPANKKPNQPPQRNAGSRPFSADSSASETPSSLGPRG